MSTITPMIQTPSVNFKGSVKRSDKGTPYYATDMGAKLFGGIGAAATVINTLALPNKAATFIGSAIGAGILYSFGHYIDNKRNQHAAEAADYIRAVGAQKALENNDKIRVADNGHLYYHSNDGRKYLTGICAGLGAIGGIGSAMFVNELAKNVPNMPKFSKAGAMLAFPLLGAAYGAFCGWIDGLIVDWLNNRSAKKHA